MTATEDALEVLHHAEVDAWNEYLHATRDQPPPRYLELEPWAWTRLQQRRRALQARREKLWVRDR